MVIRVKLADGSERTLGVEGVRALVGRAPIELSVNDHDVLFS